MLEKKHFENQDRQTDTSVDNKGHYSSL